jgi:hypothetical protein
MPWQELEASVSHLFAKKVCAGKVIDEATETVDRDASLNHFFNMGAFSHKPC